MSRFTDPLPTLPPPVLPPPPPVLPPLDSSRRIKRKRDKLVEEMDDLSKELLSAPDDRKTEIIDRMRVIEADIKTQLSTLSSKALSRADQEEITATIKSLTSQLESTAETDKPYVLGIITQLKRLTPIGEREELAKFMENWNPKSIPSVNTLIRLSADELRRFYYLLNTYDRNFQIRLKYEILYTLVTIKNETLTGSEKKILSNLVEKYSDNYKANALSDEQIDELLTVSQTLQYKSQTELIIPLQVDILYDRYKSDKERSPSEKEKMTTTNHQLFASLLKGKPYSNDDKYRDIRKYYEEERYPDPPTPSETFTYTWNEKYLFNGMNRQRTFTSKTDYDKFTALAEEYELDFRQLTEKAKTALEKTMKEMNSAKTDAMSGGGGDSVSKPYILQVGYNPGNQEDRLSYLLKFEGTFKYKEAWDLIRVYSDIVLIQYFPYDDTYSFVEDSVMDDDDRKYKLTETLFPKIFPQIAKLQKEIKQLSKITARETRQELQKVLDDFLGTVPARRGSIGGEPTPPPAQPAQARRGSTGSLLFNIGRRGFGSPKVSLPGPPTAAPPLSIHFWRGPARRTTIN